MSLFKFCQMCGKTLSSKTVFDCGAQRKVTWTCLAGHSGTWRSSPEVRGMAEVNLLAAAAVQFRGGTYTELSDWCKTMNVQTELLQVNKRLTLEKKYICYYCCCENYYSIQVTIQLYFLVYRSRQLCCHGTTRFQKGHEGDHG